MAAVASGFTGTANRVYYFQFNVPSPGITFTKYKSFAVVGAGTIGFGVMNSSCSLISGTTATATAPGAAPFAATPAAPVTLTAGTYFMAITYTASSDNLYASVGDDYYGSVADAGDASSSSSLFRGSNTSTSGVVPGSCGTRTALQVKPGGSGDALMKIILAFFFAASLWAGQSISLSNFGAALNTFPAQSPSRTPGVWRCTSPISIAQALVRFSTNRQSVCGLRCIGGGTLTLNTSYWNTGEAGSCQFTAGTDLYPSASNAIRRASVIVRLGPRRACDSTTQPRRSLAQRQTHLRG
jgi:hypothetical protein